MLKVHISEIALKAEWERFVLFGLVKAKMVDVQITEFIRGTKWIDQITGKSLGYVQTVYKNELFHLFREMDNDLSKKEEFDKRLAKVRQQLKDGTYGV